MMFEAKNFVGENDSIIEICASDSTLGLLKQYDNKNIRVGLQMFLSIGNFNKNNILDRSNLNSYKGFDEFNYNYDFNDDINKIKEYAKNGSKLRVWSSFNDVDEYLLLHLICYLFKDYNISVLYSEDFANMPYGFGAIDVKELGDVDKKEHLLSKNEKEEYANTFAKVLEDNKELRLIDNKKIVSVDINYFDNQIKEIYDNLDKKDEVSLIAKLMNHLTYNDNHLPYFVHRFLSDRFLNK